MANKHTDGQLLVNSSVKNLRWWIRTKLPNNLPKNSLNLLYTIVENIENGSKNIQRLKNHNLFLQIDIDYEAFKTLDPEANAIDFRIIYKTPNKGIINSILANEYYNAL